MIARREAKRHRNEKALGQKYIDTLSLGFAEKNPQSKNEAWIKFIDTEQNDVIELTQQVRRSVEQVISKNKTNRRLFRSGLNPVTLLTAQRRMILLQALTAADEDEMSEETLMNTRLSKLKLNQYLEDDSSLKKASLTDERSVQSDTTTKEIRKNKRFHRVGLIMQTEFFGQGDSNDSDAMSNQSDRNSVTAPALGESSLIKSNNKSSSSAQFVPNWSSYDTMRTRWGYILPQIKALEGREFDAPTSGDVSSKYLMTEDGSNRIYGKISDLKYYS